MESYKEFSEIYDLLIDDIDYDKWSIFIMDKLKQSNNILEAACGTGNITQLLASKNYNITAFDLSEDMLIKAYEKVGRCNNVSLLNQNMIDFKSDKKFDSAICCCDGVNYLENLSEVSKFFKLVYSHLNEGGKFIFDISTFYKIKHILGNETYVYENGEIFYVWENLLNEEEMKLDMEINFFKNIGGSNYKRIIEFQSQKIYMVDELMGLLKKENFRDIVVYDGYNDIPYNEDSQRAVFYCQK